MHNHRPARWQGVEHRLDEAARHHGAGAYRSLRRERPLLAIGLAGLAVAAVVFVVAPLFAFRAVRSAAEFGDVQALGQLVDYNAVRQSLRTQMRAASAERTPPVDLLHDPLGALRRAWEPVGPQTDVDRYLSPEALALLAEGRTPATGAAAVPGNGLFGGPAPKVRFWSTDRVRLGAVDPARSGRETIFTFERRKLFTWRLVGVRLPEAVPTAGAR